MLKFVRFHRKNLLSEGKTTKYFKYAIGEIVLVVIGILIALQINTCHLNRQARIQEHQFLSQRLKDYTSNLKQHKKKNHIKHIITNF